jgi:hypothetical protein
MPATQDVAHIFVALLRKVIEAVADAGGEQRGLLRYNKNELPQYLKARAAIVLSDNQYTSAAEFMQGVQHHIDSALSQTWSSFDGALLPAFDPEAGPIQYVRKSRAAADAHMFKHDALLRLQAV